MSRCLGRRSYEKTRFHFGNGKNWVYGEFQCINIAIENERLCHVCKYRTGQRASGKPNLQAQPGFKHGIIGEEIPGDSQIYGGSWYEKGILKWGEPSATDLKSLREYNQVIMKTLKEYYKVEPIDEVLEKMENVYISTAPVVTVAALTVAAVAVPVALTVAAVAVPVALTVAKKAKRKVAKKAEPDVNPEAKPDVTPYANDNTKYVVVAMEVDEEAIVPEEIIEIKLVSIRIGTKDYYHDPIKGKVYTKEKSDAIGEYQGRLKDGEIVKGIVDSDAESCN